MTMAAAGNQTDPPKHIGRDNPFLIPSLEKTHLARRRPCPCSATGFPACGRSAEYCSALRGLPLLQRSPLPIDYQRSKWTCQAIKAYSRGGCPLEPPPSDFRPWTLDFGLRNLRPMGQTPHLQYRANYYYLSGQLLTAFPEPYENEVSVPDCGHCRLSHP